MLGVWTHPFLFIGVKAECRFPPEVFLDGSTSNWAVRDSRARSRVVHLALAINKHKVKRNWLKVKELRQALAKIIFKPGTAPATCIDVPATHMKLEG